MSALGHQRTFREFRITSTLPSITDIRVIKNPMSDLAYQQLLDLEIEDGETGRIYKCLNGRHDDLRISCAMVAWAARHPHLIRLIGNIERSRIKRKRRSAPSWQVFT